MIKQRRFIIKPSLLVIKKKSLNTSVLKLFLVRATGLEPAWSPTRS